MRFDVITIFPNFFQPFLSEGLIKKAIDKHILKINIHNLRDWAVDKHRTVDDRPFGGGLGMVMKVEPIYRAVESVKEQFKENKNKKTRRIKRKIILFTPRGKKFNQNIASQLSKMDQVILICGRYEGVDERVAKYIADLKLSIGNYVLMGGELPAMVVMESVVRLIPGVIGKTQLLNERIVSDSNKKGFIEYAQYTRPEVFSPKKGIKWRVPKVLISGDHKKIKEWKEKHKRIII